MYIVIIILPMLVLKFLALNPHVLAYILGQEDICKLNMCKLKYRFPTFRCSLPHHGLNHEGQAHADHAYKGFSYSIIANSRSGYYSILDPFCQRYIRQHQIFIP